jgi:hypothetical protein
MDQNTVEGKLATGGDPQQLSKEIIAGLAEAGKFGYDAIFDETGGQADELTTMFTRCQRNRFSLFRVGFGEIEAASGRPSSIS